MTKAKTKGKDMVDNPFSAIENLELTEECKKLADKLTERELAFANLMLTAPQNGLTRPECYIKAGFSAKDSTTASSAARRLSKKLQVWEYMRSVRHKGVKQTILTLDYLDNELKKIIDADIRDADVSRLEDLDDVSAGSVQQFRKDAEGNIIDIKTYSRLDALRLASQRLGGLTDKREVTGANGGPIEISNITDIELNAQIEGLITDATIDGSD